MFRGPVEFFANMFTILVPYVFLLAIIIWIVGRKYRRDTKALKYYFASKDRTLLTATWAPFGPGCFDAGNDRIYAVEYRDAQGQVQQVYAKVASTGVVYLRER